MEDNFYQDNLVPDEQNWKDIIENSYKIIYHFKKGKFADYCSQVENLMSQAVKATGKVSTFIHPGLRSSEESGGRNDVILKELLTHQRNLLTKVSSVSDEDNEQDAGVPDCRIGEPEIPVASGLVDPKNFHDLKQLETIPDSSSLFGIHPDYLEFTHNEETCDILDVPKSAATTRVTAFCVEETYLPKRKQDDCTTERGYSNKKKRTEETNNPHCSKSINLVNDDDSVMHDETEEPPNHLLARKHCIEKATNTDFSHRTYRHGRERELWLQNGKLQGELVREEECETTRKQLYDSRRQNEIMSEEVCKAETLVYKAYEDNWKWQMELEPQSVKDQGCQCSLLETNPNNPDVILPSSMPEISQEYQDMGLQSTQPEMNQCAPTFSPAICNGATAADNDSQGRKGNVFLGENEMKFHLATIEAVKEQWEKMKVKPSDAQIDASMAKILGPFPLPSEKFRDARNNLFRRTFKVIGDRRDTLAKHLSALQEILKNLTKPR